MADKHLERGIALLVALVFLAAMALVMAVSLSWAVSSRGQGKVLAEHQKVISALDIALQRAKDLLPQPANFNFTMKEIRCYTGEFSQETTNKLTTQAPALLLFSWEEVKAGVLETAVTAEAPIFKRGTIRRAKVSFSSSLIPK